MIDVVKDGVAANDVVRMMKQRNVLLTDFTPTRVRAVTHLDVSAADIATAIEQLAEVML
jgi:threonine aldolase